MGYIINNNGREIAETNYWQTPQAQAHAAPHTAHALPGLQPGTLMEAA